MQQRRNNRYNNTNAGGSNQPMRRNNQNNRGRNMRNGNGGSGNNGGGGNRPRINVKQCMDKRDSYLNKARDIQNNDRVMAEYYLQHADHYQRLINEYNEEQEQRRIEQDSMNDYDDSVGDEASMEAGASEFSSHSQDSGVDAVDETEAAFREHRRRTRPRDNQQDNTRRMAEKRQNDAYREDSGTETVVDAPRVQSEMPIFSDDAPQAEVAPAPRRRGRPKAVKAPATALEVDGVPLEKQAEILPIGLPGAII